MFLNFHRRSGQEILMAKCKASNNREMLFLSILNLSDQHSMACMPGNTFTTTATEERLALCLQGEYILTSFPYPTPIKPPLPLLKNTMTTAPDTTHANRQWLKIALPCPLPLLEAVSDLMGVLSGTGVEQSPETETGAVISGFFQLDPAPDDPSRQGEGTAAILTLVEEQMIKLFSLYDCVPDKPTTTLLADQDWATSWQQYFKPFEIVAGLVIKPSWEPYQPKLGQHVIEMDPGMAFGTGQHASTQMSLALIKKSMRGATVKQALDVGTGTGILAMAATLFGAQRVIAIDNDPDAVMVAQENIKKNHQAEKIEVTANPVAHIQGEYQLVSANIVHDVLVEMAPVLTALTAPEGHLILAGILSGEQEENIVEVYSGLGVHPRDRLYQEEWVALHFSKVPTKLQAAKNCASPENYSPGGSPGNCH